MTDILVYLLFFILTFILLFKTDEYRFLALFLGNIFFPPVIGFTNSPYISPQNIFLYTFFFVEIIKNYQQVKQAFFSFPLKTPLLLIFGSYITTILWNDGFSIKLFYTVLRFFIETFGFLFAAFITARKIKIDSILDKLYIPIIIIGLFGLIEATLNTNLPYKIICSAFPIYDGYYNLSSDISLSNSWRIRTCFTTKHPTAFGTLLTLLILLYIPQIKSHKWKASRLIFLFGLLGINLYFCGSRTALLCTILGISLWLIRTVPLSIKIIPIGIFVFSISFYINSIVTHFSQETRGSSITLRQEQLLFSYIQVIKSPIFGNGIGYTAKKVFEKDAYGDRVKDSSIGGLESIVFFTLIDYGLFGLFSYYLLYVWIALLFFRLRKTSPEATSGLIITISATLFFSLSGNMGNASSFIYLILGLQLCECMILKQNETQEQIEKSQEPQIQSH